MPTWPNWLKHIALAVDELLQAGQWVLTRFQRMLVKAEEAEKRKSKGLSKGGRRLVEYIQNQGRSGGTGSGVLPVKALTLREKYAWLAAIHDVVCEGARPVDPYRTDKHSKRGKAVRSQNGWARRLAGMPYGARKSMVRGFTDVDRPRIERMLADVARDLGKPNPIRRQTGQTTIVLQPVNKTVNISNRRTLVRVNVQRAPAGNGKPNGTTDEWTLAEASRETGAPTWALSRAAKKPKGAPGYLPTRRVGRGVLVKREHAKDFAANYDARREQRVVGSKSKEGRNIVAGLKKIRKSSPRRARPKSK